MEQIKYNIGTERTIIQKLNSAYTCIVYTYSLKIFAKKNIYIALKRAVN
jgi:hypothetical protein